MRKSLTLLIILVFALGTTGLIFAQQNAEDEKFQKTLDAYLDALWKFYPTAATLAGYHKYDNKLEDLSEKKIENRHDELNQLNQQFVADVSKAALSPGFQIDHEMMVDALDRQLLNHEGLVPWAYNPLFYNEILADCVRSLMTGDFGTAEERTKNAADRLKNIAKLIKQAKENFDTPPRIYTEAAIKQFPAILDFYKNELPGLIEAAPASQKAKLQSELAKAVPALEDYQNFLTNELLAKSTGNFQLGTAHPRLARITFQNDIPLADLGARATADINNIEREMFLVCIPLYNIMYPEINTDNIQRPAEEVRKILINGVRDKTKGDHVAPDAFAATIERLKTEIKDFLTNNQLIDLPDNDLTLAAMPPQNQGLKWFQLNGPSYYDNGNDYTLWIAPFDPELSDTQVQSLLEEYNNYFLPFFVSRNIYPGDFVPAFFARANSSPAQKLHPNLPLIKGWPVFIEDMMIYAGWGNYVTKFRLYQLKLKLKTAIDFVLDIQIHQGAMSKEDAINYMTRVGFQTKTEAERNWKHIALNPCDAAYAYVGYQEFLDMEKAYKQKMGDSYNQKEFLSKLLSYGAIPIRHLKRKMME